MKCASFDDYYKLLEDFIKNEKLARLVEGLDGEEEFRGLTGEDIGRYLRSVGIVRIYNATGISRWTSQNRNHSVHIYSEGGMLCGKHFFSQEKELFDLQKITCKKCISNYKLRV